MATVSISGVLAGDYNRDGEVDAADYAIWRGDFGSTADLAADGNRSGVVDAADYVVWRDNLTGGTGSALALARTVPEPTTGAILVVAIGAVILQRFRADFCKTAAVDRGFAATSR